MIMDLFYLNMRKQFSERLSDFLKLILVSWKKSKIHKSGSEAFCSKTEKKNQDHEYGCLTQANI